MTSEWISVKVHPNAGKDVLVATAPGRFEAWIKAKPVQGNANAAVTALLSKQLQVPLARLRLIKGAAGRRKLFRILG